MLLSSFNHPLVSINGARTRCYKLPPLAACRQTFDGLLMTPGRVWPDLDQEAADADAAGGGTPAPEANADY